MKVFGWMGKEAGAKKIEHKREAGSRKLKTRSQKLESGNRKPEAGSRKADARSQTLETGSWKPEARSPKLKLEARNRRPEAGKWMLGARNPKRETRNWKPETRKGAAPGEIFCQTLTKFCGFGQNVGQDSQSNFVHELFMNCS